MSSPQSEMIAPLPNVYEILGQAPQPLTLTEKQVYIEIRPRITGPLAIVGKTPVLIAKKVLVTVTPDSGQLSGVRINAVIDVAGLGVTSEKFSEHERTKIENAVRERVFVSSLFPVILFQMEDLSMNRDTRSTLLRGDLTMHGKSATIYIRFRCVRQNLYEAKFKLRQRNFEIEPISVLLGGLRAEDEVEVLCRIGLSP